MVEDTSRFTKLADELFIAMVPKYVSGGCSLPELSRDCYRLAQFHLNPKNEEPKPKIYRCCSDTNYTDVIKSLRYDTPWSAVRIDCCSKNCWLVSPIILTNCNLPKDIYDNTQYGGINRKIIRTAEAFGYGIGNCVIVRWKVDSYTPEEGGGNYWKFAYIDLVLTNAIYGEINQRQLDIKEFR